MISARLRRALAFILILAVVGQVVYFPATDYFLIYEEPIPHELGGM